MDDIAIPISQTGGAMATVLKLDSTSGAMNDMEIKSFALDGRFGNPNRFSVAKNVLDSLTKCGLVYSDSSPDLVIVIGGDGSLLKSLSSRGYEGHYLLINGGTLGFLGDYRLGEWDKAVWDVTHNPNPFLEEHSPLVCIDKAGNYFYAANDVSLIAPVRAINFDLFIDNEKFATIQGTGIIVTTSLGSTAFNLSTDGPILLTKGEAYAFSLVAPIANRVTHTFARHVVLGSKSILKMRLEQNNKLYKLGGDGIENYNMTGHEFYFYPSVKKTFYLLRYHNHSMVRRVAENFSGK